MVVGTEHIEHEVKAGKLSVDVSAGGTGAAVAFECATTGAMYRATFDTTGIGAMARIFLGMPELLVQFARDTVPTITATPSHAVAHWTVSAPIKCEFEMAMAKEAAPTGADPDVADLQAENRVLRKRLIDLEKKVARLIELGDRQTAHISVLAEIAYPNHAMRIHRLRSGHTEALLSNMIIGFDINDQGISGSCACNASFADMTHLIGRGYDVNKITVSTTKQPLLHYVVFYPLDGFHYNPGHLTTTPCPPNGSCTREQGIKFFDEAEQFIDFILKHGCNPNVLVDGKTVIQTIDARVPKNGFGNWGGNHWMNEEYAAFAHRARKLIKDAGGR